MTVKKEGGADGDEEMTVKREGREDYMTTQHFDKRSYDATCKDLASSNGQTIIDGNSDEVHVQDDVKEDRRDLLHLLKDYPHLEMEKWEDHHIQEATQIYELFLVSGLSAGAATRKNWRALLSTPGYKETGAIKVERARGWEYV